MNETPKDPESGGGWLKLMVGLFALAAGLVVFHPAPRTPRVPGVASAAGWYEGADGYEGALAESRRAGKPIALYFHTEWCGWCKKMDAEVFTASETAAYLSGVAKVRIDPEKGRDEAALARKFGVRGYPTFLIVRSAGGEGTRVHPFTQAGTMSPAQFVAACRAAGG